MYPDMKPKRRFFFGGSRVEGHDFHQRLACLGDDEWLTLGGLFDETRQVRFGFVNVDNFNGITRLNLLN